MNVRTLVSAAACVATFAAGVLLGRGCSDREPARDAPPPDRPTAASEVAAAGRAHPPAAGRRTAPTTSPTRDAPAPPDPAPAADDAPGIADGDFPSADVEVVWPNGDAAAFAFVYARPAGEASGGSDPPYSECGSAGRARLHVVAPGRYDVGGLLGAFQVLATDVDLPSAGPLRLVLPDPCVVTVHMPERGGPPPGRAPESMHQLRLVRDAPDRVSWPGRGETTAGYAAGAVGAPASTWEPLAPRGARCRIDHDARFRVEPETFVAPADVRITALPRYPVRVRVEWKTPDRKYGRDVWLGVLFAREEGSSWSQYWSTRLAAGVTVGSGAAQAEFDAEFDGPSGTLRWRGNADDSVVPGAVAFSGLREDATTTIVASVELDPRAEPPSADRPAPDGSAARHRGPSFRVDSAQAPGAPQTLVCVFDADGHSDVTYVDAGALAGFDVEHPRWAIASQGRRVSDAVRLDAETTGELGLALVDGGWLVVVPATMPPEGLGTPQIARADGRPFFVDDEGCAATSWELRVGLVIGPLVPGRVTFRVTLGGRVLAEAEADVVAGRNQPLPLPRLRAR